MEGTKQSKTRKIILIVVGLYLAIGFLGMVTMIIYSIFSYEPMSLEELIQKDVSWYWEHRDQLNESAALLSRVDSDEWFTIQKPNIKKGASTWIATRDGRCLDNEYRWLINGLNTTWNGKVPWLYHINRYIFGMNGVYYCALSKEEMQSFFPDNAFFYVYPFLPNSEEGFEKNWVIEIDENWYLIDSNFFYLSSDK